VGRWLGGAEPAERGYLASPVVTVWLRDGWPMPAERVYLASPVLTVWLQDGWPMPAERGYLASPVVTVWLRDGRPSLAERRHPVGPVPTVRPRDGRRPRARMTLQHRRHQAAMSWYPGRVPPRGCPAPPAPPALPDGPAHPWSPTPRRAAATPRRWVPTASTAVSGVSASTGVCGVWAERPRSSDPFSSPPQDGQGHRGPGPEPGQDADSDQNPAGGVGRSACAGLRVTRGDDGAVTGTSGGNRDGRARRGRARRCGGPDCARPCGRRRGRGCSGRGCRGG